MSTQDDTPSETIGGLERITQLNLTEPDISKHFGVVSQRDWIALFQQHQLSDTVPEPVCRLLEIACGSMIYGWFYYPLLTSGYAECTRTLEAEAKHAAAISRIVPAAAQQRVTYHCLIGMIAEANLIQANEVDTWHLGRQIRNSFSHPHGHASRHEIEQQVCARATIHQRSLARPRSRGGLSSSFEVRWLGMEFPRVSSSGLEGSPPQHLMHRQAA